MRVVCFHLNQVGDLAFSLPALKCVRDSSEAVHITGVVRPGLKELLEASELVDEVMVRPPGLGLDKSGLARQLRAGGYDVALVFSQSASCAVLAWVTRAPKRIGFVNTSLGCLLTQRVDFRHPPSTENNLRLISAAGFEITRRDYAGMLKPSPEQVWGADGLLSEHGIGADEPVVALAPGTSGRRSVKEWTDEGFAAVGRHLIGLGMRVVVLGTEPADEIVRQCGGIVDLSGRTRLSDALAILARSRALVAVDSGILHLAAAVGTRVVGLYGPSNPRITGPQGEGHVVLKSDIECSPCVKTECRLDRRCMVDISSEMVISAVDSTVAVGRGVP